MIDQQRPATFTTPRSTCIPDVLSAALGEFVLGATYELVTLGDDIAARLAARRWRLLTHSTAGFPY